jgi:hypothetical protein
MSELKVCPKCGWYDGYTHHNECDPKLGASADQLAAIVPIQSTKLGYGFGKLTFIFDKFHAITLRVRTDGHFGVDHVYWINCYDATNMTIFVNALRMAFTAMKPIVDKEDKVPLASPVVGEHLP